MEGWLMIHRIKALYNQGKGLSIRKTAEQLDLSKTTVQKYLHLNENEIDQCLNNLERSKLLDQHQDYLIHLLQKYPKLSAVKVKRKMNEKGLALNVSSRSLRRYLHRLKKKYPQARERYYEPVLDMVPGAQCQVDLGELRDVLIGTNRRTIYFAVFVLSYSRVMYVSFSESPIDTRRFIQMHSEAWSYFEGLPEECVYDQTKLVVIREEFREVWFNDAFYRFATHAGFDCRICEGYDPESKGKVEAGVKYVKNDFFYGEEFSDTTDLQERLREWLDRVANTRVHGTTNQRPIDCYCNEEKKHLKSWHVPPLLELEANLQTRQVDKVSLISHHAVKYSVPQTYQSTAVKIKEDGTILTVHDIATGEIIATHQLNYQKGKIVKNTNHYRQNKIPLGDLEKSVGQFLGNELGDKVAGLIRATAPKIYRDQLTGLLKVLDFYHGRPELKSIMEQLAQRPRLTVTFVRDYLAACQAGEKGLRKPIASASSTPDMGAKSLVAYRDLQQRRTEG